MASSGAGAFCALGTATCCGEVGPPQLDSENVHGLGASSSALEGIR
jgi:hypothetical protein